MSVTQKIFLHAKSIAKLCFMTPPPPPPPPSAKHLKINFVRVTLNINTSRPEILT